ncbi:hypothetical protein N2W54_000765 [Lotmaria passim]
MSVIITKQRYNWMGYNGTETEEVDTALLRGENGTLDNYNYDHRQQIIAELKERLYHIKRDLDLLPEEEMRAEEEARQRRRDERKRREEEARRRRAEEEAARAEEEERQRIEDEERAEERRRQQEEDEQRRREEDEARRNAERWRQPRGDSDDDSDVEEEQNEALSAMPRTQEEIDYAVSGFVKGTRMLLIANDQGYVSYVDGSMHNSIDKLEAYNKEARAAAEAAVAGSSVSVPPAADFALDDVRTSAARQQELRKKLDAYRAQQDPTYSARVRASEKNSSGQPSSAITQDDGDEAAITARLEEAKQHAEEVRKSYNAKATASGNAIAAVMASRAGAAPVSNKAAGSEAAVNDLADVDHAETAGLSAEETMVADEAPLSEKMPTRTATTASKHSSKKNTPMEDQDEL